MKKILTVAGSPRRNGNTHILVSKITEGAKTNGAVVDELFLGDLTIRECDGCHICWKGKECSKKDDMQTVYPKIMQSDIIIFGTPVYWYGPTALMKAFIDRFVYFNCPENREKIKGISTVIAIPFEEDCLDTAAPVVDFFESCFKYLQLRFIGKIIVPGVSAKGEINRKTEYLQQAYELGRTIALG